MTISSKALDAQEIIRESIKDSTVEALIQGYVDSVNWASTPPHKIIDDYNYKSTCEKFITAITANTTAEYKSSGMVFRHILNADFALSYSYFNRPEEWSTHNPISNERLESFTMDYINQPEYQNDNLNIAIIKAYVASSIFDELFLKLSGQQSLIKSLIFSASSRSQPKYMIYNGLLNSLSWCSKWILTPCLSALLYHQGYELSAQVIAVIFSLGLFGRLTRIADYQFRRHEELSKTESTLNRIEDSIYILRVLSQDVIHLKSLRALIDLKAKSSRAVFPAPLMILLDSLEKKSSYITERDSYY